MGALPRALLALVALRLAGADGGQRRLRVAGDGPSEASHGGTEVVEGEEVADEPPADLAPCSGRMPQGFVPGMQVLRKIRIVDPDPRLAPVTRKYLVSLPSSYMNDRPLPVVMFFHGWMAEWKCPGCKYPELGNRSGFITVNPKGLSDLPGQAPGSFISWNTNTAGRADICDPQVAKPFQYASCQAMSETGPCNCYTCYDDVWFVAQILQQLSDALCIDKDRIYATGGSNGGMFQYPLAAQLVERKLGFRLAGMAPWYGVPFRNDLHVPQGLMGTPIMLSHGTKDEIIPDTGRMSSDGYYYTPMLTTLAAFAEVNGCSGTLANITTPYDDAGNLIGCQAYTGCPNDGRVVYCLYNEGHGFWESYLEEITWWFFTGQHPPTLIF